MTAILTTAVATHPAAVPSILSRVEARLALVTREQLLLEGQRAVLLEMLTDTDGAHDRRPVAVR